MIKWHEYTWYSKLAALIFFIGVLPALTFYIGTQYEKTVTAMNSIPASAKIIQTAPASSQSPYSGRYVYDEVSSTKDSGQEWQYNLFISNTAAALTIDGFQTQRQINAKVLMVGNSLDVIFDSTGPGNVSPGASFKKGDKLFSLTPVSNGLRVTWGKLAPEVPTDQTTAVFAKVPTSASN